MIVFKYLAKDVISSTLTITGVLLMIIMSARLIVYLNEAAAGIISTEMVFYIILFNLPTFLQLILPLGFFISILLVYGRLYSESEMTVLTACGVSPNKVLLYTMIPSGALMFGVMLISIWITPWCAQQLELFYQEQESQSQFSMMAPGRFQDMGKTGRVAYSQALSDDAMEMYQVFIAQGDTLIVAEKGTQYFSEETGSRYLKLENGKRFDVTVGKKDVNTMAFDVYGVKVAEERAEVKTAKREAKPTFDLMRSDDLKDQAQFHWRIGLVFLVPIITLIAFPLSKVNPRQGKFSKLLPAILIYMAYYSFLATGMSALADGNIPMEYGLWWAHGFFLVLGLLLTFWTDIKAFLKGKKSVAVSPGNSGGQHA